MKTNALLIVIIVLLFVGKLNAQVVFGTQQVITTNADYTKSVYATDIDGDGDMDILSASANDDKIAWYKNIDGNGIFSNEIIISTALNYAETVYATDIDGDGDQDVLAVSYASNIIAWFENIDGNGTFSSVNVISSNAQSAKSVYAADIDGDGDQDVLSASVADDKIAWYENTDGNGTFSAENIISTNADYALSVYSADIDGDGDQDVLSASANDNKIAWYENTDGNGTFSTENIISTNADFACSVYAADIDGDGDQDVLSASKDDNKIAWYENTDGNGTFSAENIISTTAYNAMSVYATDIDGDGDQDVLSASYADDKIAWYENTDGNGTFSTENIISTIADGAMSVYTADIDGDGDQDVLSASYADDKIAWYKNESPTTIITEIGILNQISIYPNPSNDIVTISGNDIKQITIVNITGTIIKQITCTKKEQNIDLGNQAKGIYFVKFITAKGTETKKILIE